MSVRRIIGDYTLTVSFLAFAAGAAALLKVVVR